MRIMLLVGIAWMIHAMTATAEVIFDYDPDDFFLTDPYFQDWGHQGGAGVEVLDQGQTAWQTPANQARYHQTIDVSDLQAGLVHGWKFKANARLVGGGPGLFGAGGSGLAVYANNKAYLLLLALDGNGVLQAKEFDALSTPLDLTGPNSGNAAYHDIELRWAPARQKVEFWFDGTYRRDVNGSPELVHANLARFGHIGLPSSTMNFRSVSFEVAPYVTLPDQPGDYNLDGLVNAADYTLWRSSLGQTVASYSGADGDGSGTINQQDYLVWKRHFGESATAALEAAPQQVPEPHLGLPLLLLASLCAPMGWKSRARLHRG